MCVRAWLAFIAAIISLICTVAAMISMLNGLRDVAMVAMVAVLIGFILHSFLMDMPQYLFSCIVNKFKSTKKGR